MESIIVIPGFSEPVNSLSHLLGAVFFFVTFVILLFRHHQSSIQIIAISILAFSSVFLLSMSGVYHLVEPQGMAYVVLQRLDHAAIFVMIAGTFTAVHLLMCRGVWRWGIITLVWLLATTGIVLKTIYFDDLPEIIGLMSYIGFGWLGLMTATHLLMKYGYQKIKPLVYGGIAYTVGATFDYLQYPVLIDGILGPHEIFHFAVLAGIGFHWEFIARGLRDYEGSPTTVLPNPTYSELIGQTRQQSR
jgi:channel protein (hemolysin III family)